MSDGLSSRSRRSAPPTVCLRLPKGCDNKEITDMDIITALGLVLTVSTSVWAYMDAKARGNPEAVDILVGCLLLWIICFPAYLWGRKHPPTARLTTTSTTTTREDQ